MTDKNFIESGYFVPDHGYYVFTAEGQAAMQASSRLSVKQRMDHHGRAALAVISDLVSDPSATYLGTTGRTPTTQTGIKANLAGIEFYG